MLDVSFILTFYADPDSGSCFCSSFASVGSALSSLARRFDLKRLKR